MSSTPTSPSANAEAAARQADELTAAAGPDPVAELEDQLRRALADLDNLRKRFEREVAREREAERRRVASEWLPVVDNLERALQHASGDPAALVAGVQAVRDQAVAALARLGFPRYEDVGETFDPARHEAVAQVDSDTTPGTVAAVARPGYGSDGDVLRPASVVVTKAPA
jgi:molecular chaperone GrpE